MHGHRKSSRQRYAGMDTTPTQTERERVMDNPRRHSKVDTTDRKDNGIGMMNRGTKSAS